MRRYVVLGCNHSAANHDEISLARLPDDRTGALLDEVKNALQAQEIVYLETCHRTEWYLAYDGEMCPGRLTMALSTVLPQLTRGASELPLVDRCVALQGEKAARHLFRVAAGLDALMVGETQVLGQVKEAYRAAVEGGTVGPLLQTLFEQAFRTAKRVRSETALSRRPVSLVSLADRKLRERLAEDDRPVAVLGAGEMGGMALELMHKLDPARPVYLFNRSVARGENLASRCAAKFRPLDTLGNDGLQFAAVIAATSSTSPIITAELAHRLAPCLLLDLSLPANVDETCRRVEGIEVVDQRELSSVAEANRSARAEEIGQAQAILEEQLGELAYEVMERYLSPVARRLVEAFREVARNELEQLYPAGNGNGDLARAVDRLSQRLVRVPMRGLREVAWCHSPEVLETFLTAVER